MKAIVRKLFCFLGYMVCLFLFLSPLLIFGFISGERAFFLAGPLPIACYIALIIVRSKTVWEKLWYNCVFFVGLIVVHVFTWVYVIPKYVPDTFELIKNKPEVLEESFVSLSVIYLISITLFIAVYHIGRNSKSEEKVTT